jgi:cyclopropane-fatty-acyl-phospholipid synthase
MSIDARSSSGHRGATTTVADGLRPLVARLFGGRLPIRLVFWDGSSLSPEGDENGVAGLGDLVVRSPEALRHLLWAPGELGLARAFVLGSIDLEVPGAPQPLGSTPGSDELVPVLRALHEGMHRRLPPGPAMLLLLAAVARRFDLLSRPPAPPGAEVRVSSPRRPRSIHTKQRDAEAIRHHYDIGNEFYELVLGPAMTYSCARFERPDAPLEEAQASKHDLVCRKLGLADWGSRHPDRPPKLLDVGCGWGSMAIHAAERYGAEVLGVTLSTAQATLARKRVADAGVADRVEIRVQDYRDLGGSTFDAISSIGMFEHVGERRMAEYFRTMFGLLRPEGRFLNHAISSVGTSKMRGRTFINRYVFPDGELIDVADVVRGMERAGFEVRDVESLREHYARTLRHWIANLERHWEEAVSLVGVERARVWRLYMSASVNGFEDGGIAIHQVLGVRPGPGGSSGMPPTRAGWG